MEDLSVIIPSFNEEHFILQKLFDELTCLGAEVIIVDDDSGVPFPGSIKHGTNFGYGSALMTGIKNATRPLVMTADGDGQHTREEIVRLYHAYKLMRNVDMVVGVRRLKSENFIRFAGRKFLNWTASLLALTWFPDLNSGLRIFKRQLAMGYFPILCKQFSFTTSLTMSMICDRYRVEYFPVEVAERSAGKSRVKVFKHGFITLYYILFIGLGIRTRGIRAWVKSLSSR